MIENKILDTLGEIYQMFSVYNKKLIMDRYDKLNLNEIHALAYIGGSEMPNVTKITEHLNITKGAVTKITMKLTRKGFVEPYQIDTNKKEKYFRLTAKGQELYVRHNRLHREERLGELALFEGFDEAEKETVYRFLNAVRSDFADKLSGL